MKPYAVVFAGVPGSSKTIIANYLSTYFNLPVHSNDTLRSEVKEEFLVDNINAPEALAEYERRSNDRRNKILKSGNCVVFDSSVDRRWAEFKSQLESAGYDWFLIDMDLSKTYLSNMFTKTGRSKFTQNHLDSYLQQHNEFRDKYLSDINLTISDKEFIDRIHIAVKALEKWLKNR